MKKIKKLLNKVPHVKNITNSKNKKVVNQFIITTSDGEFFQSYDSIIAFVPNSGESIYLDKYFYDYSNITVTYRNMFLSMDSTMIKKGIKDGSIELVNLNDKA